MKPPKANALCLVMFLALASIGFAQTCYTGVNGSTCITNTDTQAATCQNGCLQISYDPTTNTSCQQADANTCGRTECQDTVVTVNRISVNYYQVYVNGVCRCVAPPYAGTPVPTGQTCNKADFSGGTPCGPCG